MVLAYVVGGLTLLGLSRFGKRRLMNFEGTRYREAVQKFLIEEEGIRNRVYKDSAGINTIGIGHRILPSEKRLLSVTLTPKEIEDIFFLDIVNVENAINSSIDVALNPNQQAALMSFVFNVGANAFKKSTMLKRINEGRFVEAALEFPRWRFITIQGKKQESKSLAARRFREQKLFMS